MAPIYFIDGKKVSASDFQILQDYIQKNRVKCGDNPKPYCQKDHYSLMRDDLRDFLGYQGTPLTKNDLLKVVLSSEGLEDVKAVLTKYKIYSYSSDEWNRTKGKNPKTLLLDYMSKSRFVLIGDVHFVGDESIVTDSLPDLKKKGLKNLAIEMPIDEQPRLDLYFQKLDKKDPTALSVLSKETQEKFKEETGWKALIDKAHALGIRVVCIDQTLKKQEEMETNDAGKFDAALRARDKFLTDQLIKLQGKTVVLLGGLHLAREGEPNPTVSTLLERATNSHLPIVKLESANAVRVVSLEAQNPPEDRQFLNAFLVMFGSSDPQEPTAYLTSDMGAITFMNLDAKQVLYRDKYDAVIFLPRKNSPFLMPKSTEEALERIQRAKKKR